MSLCGFLGQLKMNDTLTINDFRNKTKIVGKVLSVTCEPDIILDDEGTDALSGLIYVYVDMINGNDDILLTQNPLKVFVNRVDKGDVLKLSNADLSIDVPDYKPTVEEFSNWVTEKFPKYVKLLAKFRRNK